MVKSPPTYSRPPVIAILGHVDHGKTTLLDYIRKTHLQTQEAGGITQTIGAYQAEFQGKTLTFIDTPGHAAFQAMRGQAGAVADLGVLVVAGDDGVKPQTIESISHLKNAGIPFIVAITKLDKPGVSGELVKAGLTKHEVFVEGYGGNTPVVELSGKTGEGVSTLLENLLLLAELEELTDTRAQALVAPIIEAKKDQQRGFTISIIVKQGTLRVGDQVVTSTHSGRVRALFSAQGKPLSVLYPGEPALLLGFSSLPQVGEVLTHGSLPSLPTPPSLSPEPSAPSSPFSPQLSLILRTDTLGSLAAIKNSTTADINLISTGTGEITEGDILLARATGALVLGFAVKATLSVQKLAETEGVTLRTFPIIYELLEYLEKKVLRLLEPTIDEKELGIAKVLKLFEINADLIAGCVVESGQLTVGDTIHLKKKDGQLKNARVKSLRIGKSEVKEVKTGQECGILTFPRLDIAEKDLIISYKKTKTDED